MVQKKTAVLIVDDEQTLCDVLSDQLTEAGYLCATASNGNDALSKLMTQDFDVALLDIRLPGISGMQVLREIRSNYRHTEAIMITAVDDAKTAIEAMKLGAADYIVKPFDPDRIDASIRTLLERKERSSERKGKQTAKRFSNRMDAIAYGVEAKIDLLSGHSQIVTQRAIEVARDLGIPEEEIREWAATRIMEDLERRRKIESLRDKVERSPLVPWLLGMTEPYTYTPKLSDFQKN